MDERNERKDSKIDLNSADAEELSRIEGIDTHRARLIIEYRAENGPFKSWEELEAVPGIGSALTNIAMASAVLGGDIPVSDNDNAEAILEADIEESNILSTLARLDLQAALAYEIVAEAVDVPELAAKLQEFSDDHFRHVKELNRLLEARGQPIITRETTEELLLPALCEMTIPMGAAAQVETLITNEQLTNGSYDLALAFIWDPDVQEVIDQARADEQRHLDWLLERGTQLAPKLEEDLSPALS